MLDFHCLSRKNKAGTVTVMAHKQGFRTLIVEGKIKVPYKTIFLQNLSHIVKMIGSSLSGLFPFIQQKRDSFISSYTLPTYYNKSQKNIVLYYEYSYALAAVDMSAKEIAETVLNITQQLAGNLLESINEELTAYNSQDP